MKKTFMLTLVALLIILCSFPLVMADEYTLRPNADGTVTLTPENCANNYECVDEASPNDDTDYVRTSAIQVYQYDLYDLPSYPGGAFDTINNVTIHYRVRCENAGGSVCKFKSYMRTESTNYEGTETGSSSASYVDLTEFYDDNPNTGSEWTITQINALQAGIGLNGFLDSDGNRARGTQVYVVVGYTPAAQPVINFTSPTPDNDTYINTNWTYINATSDIDVDVATLEFNGTNYTMTKVSNTSFYYNISPLDDCANYTYKVYANSTGVGLVGVSEERIVKVSQLDPVINWNNPSVNSTTYYNDFYINATVLNCNLSDINISIYNFSGDKFYFKQIDPLGVPSYDIYELTNFTEVQDPIKINNIEICVSNDAGSSTCENTTFIYNTNYSSPQHSSEQISDFTFSSLTYITILNETFNQSQVNNATFFSSFYAEKLNVPGQDTDIYVRYILNGNNLCDESVVTLIGSNIIRSATTCISEGELIIGENNVVIQIRRTNTGNVAVYNWDFHFENGQTNLLTDYRRDVNTTSGSITSSTFQPVLNFTTEKRTNSTTIIDYSMTITSVDPATIQCYGTNGIDFGNTLIRTTTTPLETVSMGGVGITLTPLTDNETWTLYCKQDTSTSTIDLEAYTQDTKDDSNRTMNFGFAINRSVNITNPLTLGAGKHKLLEIINYTILGSDGADITVTVNLEGLTTDQDINISIEAQNHNNSFETSHLRTLTNIGEDANIKFYGEFGGLDTDDIINITLYANVDIGEIVNIEGAVMLVRDVTDLDVDTANIPPSVLITYPENATTQWYDNQDINFSVIDFNGNLDYCNVTLNDTVVNNNTISSIKVNYTDYSYGYYNLSVTCWDTFSEFGQDSIFITLSCTEDWIPSVTTCTNSQRILTYTDSNSCGTNTTLPADNGTTQACTDINMEVIQNYMSKELVIGKDFSFIGSLYEINSTLSITNSICTFLSYINISNNETVLLDSQKYVTSGDGRLYYSINTNTWQKYTEFDAIGKSGYLEINCYCRTDCSDSSEEGCCILANGSLTTNYKYVTDSIIFNITDDDSVFAFEDISDGIRYLGAYGGLFIFLCLLSFLYFSITAKHTAYKVIIYFTMLFMMAVPIYLIESVLNGSPQPFGSIMFNIYYVILFISILYWITWYAIQRIKGLREDREKPDT